MIPTVEQLLAVLPPFKDERVLIKQNQKVDDIIKQILIAHDKYKKYYDKIAPFFDDKTTFKICQNITDFLKQNIRYVEETEQDQTTALPTAILSWRQGDCKHYSSFTGGVLDAINRLKKKKIKWCYRFASYDVLNKAPHHVFTVVFDDGGEIWLDAVPGADKLSPVWQLDETVNKNTMALHDVIGSVSFEESTSDTELPADLTAAIELLLHYGVINEAGDVNDAQFNFLASQLDASEFIKLDQAYKRLNQGVVGGLFATIARAAAKITLAPARGAFLLLVSLNFRNWAEKFHLAFTDPETGAANIEKIRAKWYPMGGDWAQLMNAVNAGKDKKMLGGVTIGEPVTAAASLATASAIVAIIIPLLDTIMKNLHINQGGTTFPISTGIDPATGLPYPTTLNTNTGSNLMNWIKQNPVPVVAVLGIGGYLYFNKKKKKITGANDNTLLLLLLAGGAFLLIKNKQAGTTETPPIIPTVTPPEPLNQLVNPQNVTEPFYNVPPVSNDANNPFVDAQSTVYSNKPVPVYYGIDKTIIQPGTVIPVNDAITLEQIQTFI